MIHYPHTLADLVAFDPPEERFRVVVYDNPGGHSAYTLDGELADTPLRIGKTVLRAYIAAAAPEVCHHATSAAFVDVAITNADLLFVLVDRRYAGPLLGGAVGGFAVGYRRGGGTAGGRRSLLHLDLLCARALDTDTGAAMGTTGLYAFVELYLRRYYPAIRTVELDALAHAITFYARLGFTLRLRPSDAPIPVPAEVTATMTRLVRAGQSPRLAADSYAVPELLRFMLALTDRGLAKPLPPGIAPPAAGAPAVRGQWTLAEIERYRKYDCAGGGFRMLKELPHAQDMGGPAPAP